MATSDPVSDDEIRAFARAYQRLAESAWQLVGHRQAIADMAKAHLGVDAALVATVGELLEPVDRPNQQLAIDELLADAGAHEVIGISPELTHYGGFSLQALLAGRFQGPSEPLPPAYDDIPIDVDRTLRCVNAGFWFFTYRDVPCIVGLVDVANNMGVRQPRIDIFSPDLDIATALLDDLRQRRRAHNVYRGKMLSFLFDQYGGIGIRFVPRPTVRREQVILPAADLDSIDRHAIGIGKRAADLVRLGRHVKRGLLLYGPPGTGKTLTVGYLAAAMAERTVIVIQGRALGALGQAAALVRELTPSMLVLEDVDLIAMERDTYGIEANPLLFELLNIMDGLGPDLDVVFVLTTNRVDILEPALATRPGRIDHAVEIGLPDEAARRQLLDLYLEGVPHDVTDTSEVIRAIEGVTASFVKELVRRAVLFALDGDQVVHTHDLTRAATEMLEQAAPIHRAMHGGARRAPALEPPWSVDEAPFGG